MITLNLTEEKCKEICFALADRSYRLQKYTDDYSRADFCIQIADEIAEILKGTTNEHIKTH